MKRLAVWEVEDILKRLISELDMDEFCCVTQHITGVSAEYDIENNEILLTKTPDYAGAFGDIG